MQASEAKAILARVTYKPGYVIYLEELVDSPHPMLRIVTAAQPDVRGFPNPIRLEAQEHVDRYDLAVWNRREFLCAV